ncbi:MAG: hypothetical protein OXL36_21010 [Bryobacterales bacterium]|nr:hypothetical protein [Bryobacterales bacterium]MDE0294935.1 hypothetical protein [Bryobacterales bacterium]
MRVDELKCVTFSGTGYAGKVGQNVTQDTDWPDGEPLANYTRTINYEARSSVKPSADDADLFSAIQTADPIFEGHVARPFFLRPARASS